MTNYYRTGLLLGAILMLGACNRYYRQAYGQTENLKEYGLVFRLQDDKRRMEYYEKKGLGELAKTEKSKLERDNRNLVQYFQQEFDFCPVRFYYASQQTELLAGEPVLLNSDLQPDATIPLPGAVLLANFAPGELVDNTFAGTAFRVLDTPIEIRPTFKTWLSNRPLQREDVRKINRILHKMNNPKYIAQ